MTGTGKAVVGALKKADQSKNRLLRVHEAVITQRKVLELAKKASPGSQRTETAIEPRETLQSALKNFEENPADFTQVFGLLKALMLSGDYTTEYTEVDNELVGLLMLTTTGLEEIALSLLGRQP